MNSKINKYYRNFGLLTVLAALFSLPLIPYARLADLDQPSEVLSGDTIAFSKVFGSFVFEASLSAKENEKKYERIYEFTNSLLEPVSFKVVAGPSNAFHPDPYFGVGGSEVTTLRPNETGFVNLKISRTLLDALDKKDSVIITILSSL